MFPSLGVIETTSNRSCDLMARAFWKGSISFGLVEIPVSLQPAVQTHDLDFSLLDRKDFSPVGFKRFNKNSGRDVPREEVVRGYEYEPDEYVVLTDEEIARANVERSQTIDIVQFVERDEIDPLYYETPYYIEPLKKASKSYALLRAALEKSRALRGHGPDAPPEKEPRRADGRNAQVHEEA